MKGSRAKRESNLPALFITCLTELGEAELLPGYQLIVLGDWGREAEGKQMWNSDRELRNGAIRNWKVEIRNQKLERWMGQKRIKFAMAECHRSEPDWHSTLKACAPRNSDFGLRNRKRGRSEAIKFAMADAIGPSRTGNSRTREAPAAAGRQCAPQTGKLNCLAYRAEEGRGTKAYYRHLAVTT